MLVNELLLSVTTCLGILKVVNTINNFLIFSSDVALFFVMASRYQSIRNVQVSKTSYCKLLRID